MTSSEVERLRQHVETVDRWRQLHGKHERKIKAPYGEPPFRQRKRANESDHDYTTRNVRLQNRIIQRIEWHWRRWLGEHPTPEPNVTPDEVLDEMASKRGVVKHLFPYAEGVIHGGLPDRREQELKESAAWWDKHYRGWLAKVRQLTQIVPSITDHPLLDESKASTPLVGIDRIEQWCRAAVVAMHNPPKVEPQSVANGSTGNAVEDQQCVDAEAVKLPPRVIEARDQYLAACEALGTDSPTDREAYDLIEMTAYDAGEPSPLPTFGTWTSYLRQWRGATGQQKNKPRGGREAASGSVVKQGQD